MLRATPHTCTHHHHIIYHHHHCYNHHQLITSSTRWKTDLVSTRCLVLDLKHPDQQFLHGNFQGYHLEDKQEAGQVKLYLGRKREVDEEVQTPEMEIKIKNYKM